MIQATSRQVMMSRKNIVAFQAAPVDLKMAVSTVKNASRRYIAVRFSMAS